jgi:hypothetical protein
VEGVEVAVLQHGDAAEHAVPFSSTTKKSAIGVLVEWVLAGVQDLHSVERRAAEPTTARRL